MRFMAGLMAVGKRRGRGNFYHFWPAVERLKIRSELRGSSKYIYTHARDYIQNIPTLQDQHLRTHVHTYTYMRHA